MGESEDNYVVSGLVVLFVCVAIIGLSSLGIFLGNSNDDVEEIEEYVEVDDSLLFISGTEYAPGQEGQLAVLVMNNAGDIVTDEYDCNYTILYPDKTVFEIGNFSNMTTSIGTYYVNFTILDDEGVYEYLSTCRKGAKRVSAGKSFHVTVKRLQAVMPK